MASRAILTASIAGAVLALAACHPPFMHRHDHAPYKSVTTLDCPQTQGNLTRKTAAADGKSCEYTASDGAAVTLQVLPVANGDVDAALAPLEASLRAEAPGAGKDDVDGGDDKVDIDLPGIHIHASGKDGGKDDSGVKIGRGVSVGASNTVVVGDGGGVDIRAHDKGAEIRVNEGHGGTRRDFILASDVAGPHGYKVAGYEARGPHGGPLVVASMLAKSDDHDQLSHAIRELVRLNVGG